tara:strand:- start:1090 stop:1476 length:387 start_codon:yes stop_codon:yes gene_type:complete
MMFLSSSALAVSTASNLLSFDSEMQQQRYYRLLNDIRCPKCQNQNLADSDAQIALDLRNQLYHLIKDGHDDDEIYQFMSSRYGNFVLYDPPLNKVTAILWYLPMLIFLLSVIIIVFRHAFNTTHESSS